VRTKEGEEKDEEGKEKTGRKGYRTDGMRVHRGGPVALQDRGIVIVF